MDFSELLNNILSNDIFKGIWDLVGPVIITIVGILWGKAKKKLTTLASNSDNNLMTIMDELKHVVSKLDAVETRCAELAEENKAKDAELTSSITNVGNMVSIGFLDTKGISADAKIKISESVAFLAKNGLDISKTQEAVDVITKNSNEKIEAIVQAKEITEAKAKESEEKAATTETEAISLMNRIIETHEQ